MTRGDRLIATSWWVAPAIAMSVLLSALALRMQPAPNGREAVALRRLARPPLGLPALSPETLPTAGVISLGRKLFVDRSLSINDTMSCGMCHIPEQGFTSNELVRPLGVEGRSLQGRDGEPVARPPHRPPT
jgi:cytochrome c peroxidase